jgi:hypothetical protein
MLMLSIFAVLALFLPIHCLPPPTRPNQIVEGKFIIIVIFLAASTECSAGSNDHFVGGGVVPSLVQFDGRPLGGTNFQYYHCAIWQPCNATLHATLHATLQHNNHATFNATITQPCNTTITQHCNT